MDRKLWYRLCMFLPLISASYVTADRKKTLVSLYRQSSRPNRIKKVSQEANQYNDCLRPKQTIDIVHSNLKHYAVSRCYDCPLGFIKQSASFSMFLKASALHYADFCCMHANKGDEAQR